MHYPSSSEPIDVGDHHGRDSLYNSPALKQVDGEHKHRGDPLHGPLTSELSDSEYKHRGDPSHNPLTPDLGSSSKQRERDPSRLPCAEVERDQSSDYRRNDSSVRVRLLRMVRPPLLRSPEVTAKTTIPYQGIDFDTDIEKEEECRIR